ASSNNNLLTTSLALLSSTTPQSCTLRLSKNNFSSFLLKIIISDFGLSSGSSSSSALQALYKKFLRDIKLIFLSYLFLFVSVDFFFYLVDECNSAQLC